MAADSQENPFGRRSDYSAPKLSARGGGSHPSGPTAPGVLGPPLFCLKTGPGTVPSRKKPVQEAATTSPGALRGPMGEVAWVNKDAVLQYRTNEDKMLKHGCNRQAEGGCETIKVWMSQFIRPRVKIALHV